MTSEQKEKTGTFCDKGIPEEGEDRSLETGRIHLETSYILSMGSTAELHPLVWEPCDHSLYEDTMKQAAFLQIERIYLVTLYMIMNPYHILLGALWLPLHRFYEIFMLLIPSENLFSIKIKSLFL